METARSESRAATIYTVVFWYTVYRQRTRVYSSQKSAYAAAARWKKKAPDCNFAHVHKGTSDAPVIRYY